MNEIFKKMNFKGSDKIYVIKAPKEFKPILEEMKEITHVKSSPNCKQEYDFALFFIQSKADLEKYAEKAAQKVPGDGLLWFAYPKKTSKKYKAEISRDDDAWKLIGQHGFEPVRMIAIDEDWSALRFRRVEYIKNMKRNPKMKISSK